MANIKDIAIGRSDMFRVDPRKLVIEAGWNGREEGEELDAHIDMLAQSIAVEGVKKPIEVKMIGDNLVVREGHCRTRATIRAIEHYGAEIESVPVITVAKGANDLDLIVNQWTGNSGRSFTPIEEANLLKRMLAMGVELGAVAPRLGKSVSQLNKILELLELPESVKVLVSSKAVSASLAVKTVSENGDKAGAKLLADAAKAALEEAQANGTKVTRVKPEAVTRTVKNIMQEAEIDNSEEDFVTIKVSAADFEILRKTYKL